MPSQLMDDIRKKEGVAGLKEKARRDPRGVVTFQVSKLNAAQAKNCLACVCGVMGALVPRGVALAKQCAHMACWRRG